MRSRIFAAVALGLLATAAAPAQDRPRYVPTRDVTVAYRITSNQPGVPESVVAHISADGHLRLETGDKGYVLYDAGSEKAKWVLPQGGIYMELPVGNGLAAALIPGPDVRFTREGHDTIAGLSCTEWQVAVPRGGGKACVTTDGVILRGEGGDASGHNGTITATSVAYAPQPAALFVPPHGAQRFTLPTRLPGLRIGP